MSFLFSRKRGFSLAEITIAVAIVALISSVVIANLQESRKKSRDVQRVSDMQQIQLGLRAYRDAESASDYPAYASGDLIGDGAGIDTVFLAYVTGTIKDPLNSGSNRYYYDSAYTCNGTSRVILVAQTMERTGAGNYASVCGATTSSLGNGVTPTTNSYVVILK